MKFQKKAIGACSFVQAFEQGTLSAETFKVRVPRHPFRHAKTSLSKSAPPVKVLGLPRVPLIIGKAQDEELRPGLCFLPKWDMVLLMLS